MTNLNRSTNSSLFPGALRLLPAIFLWGMPCFLMGHQIINMRTRIINPGCNDEYHPGLDFKTSEAF